MVANCELRRWRFSTQSDLEGGRRTMNRCILPLVLLLTATRPISTYAEEITMTSGEEVKRWSLENYDGLIRALPKERYAVFVTGTEADGGVIADTLSLDRANVTSLIGRLALSDLVGFIGAADALVCGSTGPLHVAAALGKCAIGFYMPIGIAHPRRYGPVGVDVHPLLYDPDCARCRDGLDCDCLQGIPTSAVLEILEPLAHAIVSSRRG